MVIFAAFYSLQDVGSGLGHLSRILAYQYGYKVTAIEMTGHRLPVAEKYDKYEHTYLMKIEEIYLNFCVLVFVVLLTFNAFFYIYINFYLKFREVEDDLKRRNMVRKFIIIMSFKKII